MWSEGVVPSDEEGRESRDNHDEVKWEEAVCNEGEDRGERLAMTPL